MRAKVVAFILICLIPTKAYAYPIGYEEIQSYTVADPEEYMEINKVDVSLEVEEACEKYGEEYGICPEIGEGLCWKESRCKADAVNGSCKGVAQINTKIHTNRMKRLGVTNIFDIDQCIHVSFDYLAELEKKNHNLAKSLDEYNGNAMNGNSKYAKQILTVASCLDRVGGG